MRRKTTEDFIIKSKSVHGDLYSYEKTKYTKSRDRVVVTCRRHGDFNQIASMHASGHGCPLCGFELTAAKRSIDFSEFLERSRVIHGFKYEYPNQDVCGIKSRVEIVCPEHGSFHQLVREHLNGNGCHGCARKIQLTHLLLGTEEFIKRSKLTHGDTYDYSLSSYEGSTAPIDIACKIHGVFKQAPSAHYGGQGCPSCSVSGFKKILPGYVYFLVSECGGMIKVGITNNIKGRMRTLKSKTPFMFSLIEVVRFDDGVDAINEEARIHNSLTSANLSGFSGSSEWFIFDGKASNELSLARKIKGR